MWRGKIDSADSFHQSNPGSENPFASNLREIGMVAASAVAFAILFAHPMLGHLTEPGGRFDWDLFRGLAWVSWKTVVGYHQVPVWDPYMCGGVPLIGDPQTDVTSPMFLVHLLFGPMTGLHLEILIHLAIAWAGGYVLARVLGLGTLARVFCATIFPSSSWFFLQAAVGHHHFLPAGYWPWVLAFALLALERHRIGWAAIAGVFIAMVLLEGAPYQTSYVVLLLGLLLIPIGIVRRDLWALVVLGGAVAVAAGFVAVKLIPSAALIARYPRDIIDPEMVSFGDIATALFDRNQDCNRPFTGRWSFFEAGAYLSPFFIILAIAGATRRARESWPWILAGAIALATAFGSFGYCAPWTLLHRLPVFSSERVATRLLVPFVLCFGVLTAYGADFFARKSNRWGTYLATLLLVCGAIDCLLVGPPNLVELQSGPEEQLPVSEAFKQFFNEAHADYVTYTPANIGILKCYQYTDIPTTALGYNQKEYKGEQHLIGPGVLKLLRWTPNALSYSVESPAPNLLVINQNYDSGWRITEGAGRVSSNQGLLAVELPSGRQDIRVANFGNGLILGFVITLVTGVGVALLWLSGL